MYQFLTKVNVGRQIMVEILNLKFHENPSDVNRVVQCADTEGRTANIANLTAGFCSFFTHKP